MKQFGSTINETISAFRSHLGTNTQSQRNQAVTRILLSFLLLLVAVFLVIKSDLLGGESSADIGKMIFGALLGYWLK